MSSQEQVELATFSGTNYARSTDEQQQVTYRRASVANVKRTEVAMYSLEKNPEKFPDGGLSAYTVLFGSFCGLIADFGIPNSLGAIEAYVSTNQLSSTKLSTVSLVFSLHMGVMFFCGVFSGNLFDAYGSRKLLLSGTILMCGGLLATAELKTLYQFVLAFSICTAIGTSLAMAPLIGVLSHWFLKKRGFACSVATVGGLVGSSIFAVMLQRLYAEIGFKWAMRILSLICGVCMVVSMVLVKDGPAKSLLDGEDEDHALNLSAEIDAGRSWKRTMMGFLDFALFRDIRFVSLAVAVFLSELIALTVLMFLASYALANGISLLKSYLLLTVVNLSGIPSRLITGLLADSYGRFNVMTVTSIFTAIFIFSLLFTARGRLPVLYAFGVLYGCSSSAVLSLIAACLSQICPASSFGKYYGVLYFCLAFMTILGIYISSLMIDSGSPSDYQKWILFEGGISVAAVLAWVWARYTNVGFRMCKF